MSQRVGIVVPTRGDRPAYLAKCLHSIRKAGQAHILVVAPGSMNTDHLISLGLVDSVVRDAGGGLPAAINQGIRALPSTVEYVNWIGDDDLLTLNSLVASSEALDKNHQAVMAFGSCEYIDSLGNPIWTNRSGQWAVPLLRFGPDLIPQPGALFRRSSFEKAGELKTELGWAFDFELFIRLAKLGKLIYLNQTLSQFRWHPESLSVEHRKNSVDEASRVRVSHLPALLRPISLLWEYPVRQATLLAGMRVTAKAQVKARIN